MSGTASDVVKVAKSQIGITSSKKYTKWFYGVTSNVSWCAIFVSWCMNQAGVSTSICPKFATVTTGRGWFKEYGLFHAKGSYTPKAGDVIFFNWSGSATSSTNNHVGIVTGCSGGSVSTIEGNTSSPRQVKAHTYSLSSSSIIGYGAPKYAGSSVASSKSEGGTTAVASSGTSSSSTVHAVERIVYLKDVANESKANTKSTVKVSGITSQEMPDLECHIYIFNGSVCYEPIVKDGITWATEYKGTPGQLKFTVVKDDVISFEEGNAVKLVVNDEPVFYGFVFQKSRDKQHHIEVTAYDQLRYLKNKDTYVYTNKTASEVIKMIASDFDLNCGTIEDTAYKIAARSEDNQTLFDIIQNALDETLKAKSKLYILYDKVGKLMLQDVASMKLDLLICEDTAQDFSYTSSIDGDTYDQIKLVYENDNAGTRDVYMMKDSKHISKWGVLQYYEKLQDPTGASAKADAFIKLYNQKTRNLTVKDCFGDLRIHAGVSVIVNLDLGDLTAQNYMVVEKVTHTFSEHLHTMDLTLMGGEFIA